MSWESALVKSLENEIKKDNVQEMYNTDFYNDHQKYRVLYDFIGDIIYVTFEPKSVIDLGCGAGFLLERLRSQGVSKIYGIDGSKDATNSWPEHMQDVLEVKNLMDFKPQERYDVAICMEVAEHIPKDKSLKLVTKVTESSKKFIWWTAAPPGQGGTGHINCQDVCYWVRHFEQCGFIPAWELTYRIKMELLRVKEIQAYPWFRDNCLILKRVR